MKPAILSPQARHDLRSAIKWIERDNPAAARAFVDAVILASNRIGEHAEIGRARGDIAPLPFRFLMMSGFPYVITYNSERRPPLIIRILHGARDLAELFRDD